MAAFFMGLFGSLASFFAQWMSKKAALGAAAAAAFTAMTLAFAASISALVAGIAYAMPADIGPWVGAVVPDNFSACVSAVFSARLARWAYEWNVENLRILSYVT